VTRSLDTVSVLIPCYNQAAHIGHTIEATLNQTRSPHEVIVVDDASTDASAQIVGQYPVKLLRHRCNSGPAVARNTALQAASGEIVLYVDADAYAEAHLVETLLSAYEQHPSPQLAGVGGRGIETQIHTPSDRWRVTHAKQDFGDKRRYNVPYLFGLCASYYREVLLEVGGFDAFFPINAGEDADLGYRLIRAGYYLLYLPEAVVYHQHSDTTERLRRVQYNWFYWSYLAKQRSGLNPLSLVAGTIRRLFTETLSDALIRHDLDLVKEDIAIFQTKMSALLAAMRSSPPSIKEAKSK